MRTGQGEKISTPNPSFNYTGLVLPFVDEGSLEAIFSEDLFYELFSSLHTLHLGFFNLPFNIYAEGVDSLSLLASIPLPHLIQLGFEIYPPLRPDPD